MDFYSNSNNSNNVPQNTPNGFAIASMVCGIFSIILCCTGILSISAGALSILFAVLSKRKNTSMPIMSWVGIWLSIVGVVLGILMTVYSFYLVFNDPLYREQVDVMFEQMYGMSLDEYLANPSQIVQ